MSRFDETIFANFGCSVVRLHSPGGTGNGFVVYSMGGTLLVMSCEHIMEGVSLGFSMPAYFSDKSNETATLLHVDKDKDLSLLKIADSQRVCTPVHFFNGCTVSEMDVVMLSFFKMEDAYVVSPGTFQGKIVGPPSTRRGPPTAQTPKHECVRSNYVAKLGTSGSPVFLISNSVVGVHVSHAHGFTYAVSVPTIKAALRGWLQLENENDLIQSMLTRLASPQAQTHEERGEGVQGGGVEADDRDRQDGGEGVQGGGVEANNRDRQDGGAAH